MATLYSTDTTRAFELHALTVQARDEVKQLTGVQEYAVDLYERGFNPFPIPSAHDWILRGGEKKSAYKLEPLYRNRMHYVKDCGCSTCYKDNFVTLFENSNIAVMCGATSGNLLSIDCDTKEKFKFMGDELAQRGLEFWAFTSHRGGQYLLRVLEGEIANIPQEKSKFDDVQIWGSRHLIVVPPSIHPKGTVYQWLSPEPLNMLPYETLQTTSIEALVWLGVTLKKYRKSKSENDISGLPEYAKNLSNTSQETLLYGAKQGGRNSALTALSADLVGIGLDEDETRSALQMAADNCIPAYDDRDHKIERILEWAFSKERKPSRKFQLKTNKGSQDWQQAQDFAKSFDWRCEFKGKSSFARRAFDACVERARLDSRSNVFRAATREIAKLANMNKNTTSAYLRLFVKHGLLLHEGNEASWANIFTFGSRIKAVQYSNTDILLYENYPTKNNTLPAKDAERDAFNKLGTYAYPIWLDLLVTPATTIYAIAKRLGLNKDTVKVTIKRLIEATLVGHSQSEDIYYGNAFTDAQLERIAIDRGTFGIAKGKQAQFVKERELYVNYMIGKAKEHHKRESARLERNKK